MVGYRPPIGLAQIWEIATRAGPPLKGGSSRAAHQLKPSHVPTFHAHPTAYGSAAPARTARDQVHSFLRTVRDGVFAPLKTDPARAHFAPTSFRLPPRPVRLPVGRAGSGSGARFGSAARRPTVGPPPFPSHPAHVGLGAARNFSAGAQPFANVVSNVPLALRALGGEGLDERKWRHARREIRHQLRKDVKGKGRELSFEERQQMRQAEFAAFFGSKAEMAASVAAESVESVAEMDAVFSPVVLVLPLEPALAIDAAANSDQADSHARPSSSYRLLPDTVLSSLDAIQHAYATHANRVRALSNRLTRAGVFDDPATAVELVFVSDGRKEVHLTFGPKWTRRDVTQAAGGWRGEEATFWDIVGGQEGASSVPSVRSDGIESSMDEHDAVKSTFVLPTHSLDFDATAYSSPALSPTASSFASFDGHDRALEPLAPSLTEEAQVWTDFDYPAAEPFSPALVSHDGELELGGDDDRWSVNFEDEGSDAGAEPSTEAWSEPSYESEVRDFLVEVEQGMAGQRMFARI